MKRLHRPDLYGWSAFQTHVDIDFNSVLWTRTPEQGGNVVVDPLPLSDHDAAQLDQLGGVAHIVITNSRHVRGAVAIVEKYGASILAPAGEQATFPLAGARFLGEGDTIGANLRVFALNGSKTPGELALLLDGTTLICGDLIRSHRAGQLQILRAEQGLADRAQALHEVARLAAIPTIDAVLVGDGFSVYRDGARYMAELRDSLRDVMSPAP